MRRLAPLLLLASLLPYPGHAAADVPTGPTASAVTAWFTTSRSVACVGADGIRRRCEPGADTSFTTSDSPDGSRSLTFVRWTPDTTGSAESVTAVLLERRDGVWHVAQEPRIVGTPTGEVVWKDRTVTYATLVPRPGDPVCCPTAREIRTLVVGPSAVAVRAGDAPPGDRYDHNGSTMAVDFRAGTIVYARPRPGLAPAVQVGTVLFRGTLVRHGAVSGTAFAFRSGCAPAPYPVVGKVVGDTVVLRGDGPVRKGCDVVALSPESPHTVLRFRALEPSLEDHGGDE